MVQSSTLFTSGMDDELSLDFERNFPFQHLDMSEGIKYLGFNLKPNSYGKEDWWWLVSKIEKRVTLGVIDGYQEGED
jgi:hypothetical protein